MDSTAAFETKVALTVELIRAELPPCCRAHWSHSARRLPLEPQRVSHAPPPLAALVARRAALLSRVQKVDGHLRSQASEEVHVEDPGVVHANDRVLECLSQADRRELDAIDGALRRIHTGSYGLCAACNEPIESGRLESLPSAPRCRACETRREHMLR